METKHLAVDGYVDALPAPGPSGTVAFELIVRPADADTASPDAPDTVLVCSTGDPRITELLLTGVELGDLLRVTGTLTQSDAPDAPAPCGSQRPGTPERSDPGKPPASWPPRHRSRSPTRNWASSAGCSAAAADHTRRRHPSRRTHEEEAASPSNGPSQAGAASFASAASGERRPFSTARSCSQSTSGCAGTTASTDAVV